MTAVDLFAARLAADPSGPLITYYDDSTGERTEVSAATTANWVAKTANLAADELLIDAGAVVGIDLPAHWQTLVWLQAVWSCGAAVALPPWARCDAAVVRYVDPLPTVATAGDLVVLSLLPLGRGCPAPLQSAVDYAVEVRAHGDAFAGPSPRAAATAVVDGGAVWTHDQVVGSAHPLPQSRVAVTADSLFGMDAVRLWVSVLAARGSLVLLAGAVDAGRRSAIATMEHATLLNAPG
jgi:uncharacterized protein (TIGR03089 family)